MPKPVTVLALAASLVLAVIVAPIGPALAQSPPAAPPQDQPGALARDAIEKMMRALSIVIENLPQYALPEINERGDIVIRRLNPRAEEPRRAPETQNGART